VGSRFLAAARKYPAHLFPELPKQLGYFKRRRRLADTLEWLMGIFASQSRGFQGDLLLIDSTPVPCARKAAKRSRRSALGEAADDGYCASHSRYFWGVRLHAIFPPTAPPERWRSPPRRLTSAKSASGCSGVGVAKRRDLRGDPTGISKLHGQAEIITIGIRAVRLYPLYHPAAALYTRALLDTLRADMARLPELLAMDPPAQPEPVAVVEAVPEPEIVTQPARPPVSAQPAPPDRQSASEEEPGDAQLGLF